MISSEMTPAMLEAAVPEQKEAMLQQRDAAIRQQAAIKEGSERTAEVLKELRDKIRSKFQVTTFLAGFGFAILNAQIGFLRRGDQIFLLPVSIAVMAAAVLLFVAAVALLDGLMLPKMFWPRSNPQSVPDPYLRNYGPDALLADFDPPYVAPGDLWKIKNCMVFYWTWLTIIATALTFTAIVMAILPYSIDQAYEFFLGYTFHNQEVASAPSAADALWDTLYFIGWTSLLAILYIIGVCLLALWKYGRLRWD